MTTIKPELWKQFSLYPKGCRNKFQPQQVLYTFLPNFISDNPSITMWHCLFEPSALVRFQASNLDTVFQSAKELASKYGLEFEPGDCSVDLNPKLACPGEDYDAVSEIEFYGLELWEANKRIMWANSLLALALVKKDPKTQVFMFRKFIHLFHNACGLNFLEEAAISAHWQDRCMELYKKHGRT